MRVDSEGRGTDAEKFASRLHFSPEFGQKVADQMSPGTTVIVTDRPVVRKPWLIPLTSPRTNSLEMRAQLRVLACLLLLVAAISTWRCGIESPI